MARPTPIPRPMGRQRGPYTISNFGYRDTRYCYDLSHSLGQEHRKRCTNQIKGTVSHGGRLRADFQGLTLHKSVAKIADTFGKLLQVWPVAAQDWHRELESATVIGVHMKHS